ncbi:helix-turn-helix domain-containing protein [Oceanobacillus kimchii]|uniref:helix-turn-helix domain-containing protein n=1 Tax=Oceanobacillus kimchii TaxID=746691 RepID=UPI001FCAB729|nr:helix-turn-helix transcriptional regulator [Oceanobacillus kimchii]
MKINIEGDEYRLVHFGYMLKFYRQEQKMTQSELADGIISISYLSKIENKYVDPPDEIKELLCSKLGINETQLRQVPILDLCQKWFQSLFLRNINSSVMLYKQLCSNKQLITVQDMNHLFEIHKLRYYLIQNDKQKIEEQFQKLQLLSPYFTDAESFYWLKFIGQYYFSREKYKKAIDYFQKSLDRLTYIEVSKKEEKHDVFYMIALSASYIRETYTTLIHAQQTLIYYQKQYNFKRTAQCYLLLGISHSRMQDYEAAMNSYQQAKKIADRINNINLQTKCYQNIGYLFSECKQSEQAIEYYKKSFVLRAEPEKQLYPIIGLMKEYYRIHDLIHAKEWLDKGLAIVEEDDQSIYRYELDVYNQLINKVSSKLEEIILEKIIPFADEKQLYLKKTAYLEILATHYYGQRKYKLAATYYNHALHTTKAVEGR